MTAVSCIMQIRVTIPLGMVCGDVFSKVIHAYHAIACTVWFSQKTHTFTAARISQTIYDTSRDSAGLLCRHTPLAVLPAMHTATAPPRPAPCRALPCPLAVGRQPTPVRHPAAPLSCGQPLRGLTCAVLGAQRTPPPPKPRRGARHPLRSPLTPPTPPTAREVRCASRHAPGSRAA